MSFEGRAGDPTRNIIQERLFKSIGNKDTVARSTEIAVRAENELFKRTGPGAKYAAGAEKLCVKLQGMEVQRKLLMGAVAPEAWVQRHVKATAVAKKAVVKKPAAAAAKAPAAADAKKEKDEEKPLPSGSSVGCGQGAGSAYYFFKSTDKEQAKAYVPKKLDASDASRVEEQTAAQLVAGQSKWNKHGTTWEETDHSKWARRRLCELLEGIQLGEEAAVSLVDDEKDGIWKVEGDASVTFSRGKRRVGFELKVKAKYTATHNGSKVKGKIELPCVDDVDGPDGDYLVKISADKGDAAHTHVRSSLRKTATPKIREQVDAFIKELYQR